MNDRQTILNRNLIAQPPCCDPQPRMQVDAHELRREVELLSALADHTRLAIVAMLADLDEPLCVCEIVAQFELGQPTISHHLKILRDANIVTTEKRGLWVYYSINRQVLDSATSYLHGLVAAKAVGAGA